MSSCQIIALALPALVGTCLLVRGVLLLADKRPKSAAISKVNGITPGDVAVYGTATGPYSITAPITGKNCYLYRTAVWQQKKAEAQGWEKVADETLHVPFFLEDSTGQLLIEPLGADLQIPISLREEYAAAVEQKQVAEQQAQQAKLVVEQRRQEAEQARQVAQGQADAAVISAQGAAQARIVEAEAEAKALGLIAAAIQNNPEILQYQYILKLAPGVQTIFIPSGNQFILPLPTVAPTPTPAP
jgi:hypothetical protein